MTQNDDLFQKAERLEETGDVYAALECWRQLAAIKADPTVLCRLASAATELDLLDEAEGALRSALELDGSLTHAYSNLAILKMERHDSASAEALLKQALARDEMKAAPLYCLLGSAQLDLDRIEDARQSFRLALEIDPAYDEAFFNLGVTYRDSNTEEAERLFRKALDLDNNCAPYHRELGYLLLRTGEWAGAEYHLRRSRELDPESLWGRIYLANLLWQQESFEEARQEYIAAVLLDQEYGFPRYLYANFLEGRGELDEAESMYREALALEPDNPDTLAKLGGVLLAKQRVSAAREFVTRALLIDPQNRKALKVLSRLESTTT